MATFIVLASFTDKGIGKVKETIGRAEKFKEMAKKSGIAVKDLYWTLGSRDVVAVCEAPDDESATALSLSVCSRGNVRSETLRAFSFEEMKKIIGRWSEGAVSLKIHFRQPCGLSGVQLPRWPLITPCESTP
jgi:uncharacterized protein with GYD domain